MKKILVGLYAILACGLGAVEIDEVKVREELYPKVFKNELQKNLDFFKDGVGVDEETKVPYDTITIKDGKIEKGYYTNTSEIGLYLNILVEMEKAGDKDALERIGETLATLEEAPKWNGLFYWPYDIRDGKLVKPETEIVPAVDNGNLAFALAGVAGAYLDSKESAKKDIVKRIEIILENQREGWRKLADNSKGLLYAGWDTKIDAPLQYFIDRKGNESRTGALWSILITSGTEKEISKDVFNNMELYTLTYEIGDFQYKPMLTWDGTVFQALLPSIWLNEKELMPNYGIVEDFLNIQIYYTQKFRIPALISSSATTDGGYTAYGVPYLSESKNMFNNEISIGIEGTPHASALAYIVDKEKSLTLLYRLKEKYPQIESEYGWYDVINEEGKVGNKILSLDQGMFVGAFLAEEINKDVEKYLEYKGYLDIVKELYKSYVPNN